MSLLTTQRAALRAAVEPLLREGEEIAVAVAPCEFSAGLQRQHFTVTIGVGPAGEESAAERLDELLSGAVKDALEASDLTPTVTKTSGYQSLARPGGITRLGATWTVELLI